MQLSLMRKTMIFAAAVGTLTLLLGLAVAYFPIAKTASEVLVLVIFAPNVLWSAAAFLFRGSSSPNRHIFSETIDSPMVDANAKQPSTV